MPKAGTVIGDILETFKSEGTKALKETGSQLAGSFNILEGLDPVNSSEVAAKSKQYKAEEKAKLAKIRSGLAMMQETAPRPQEDRRIETGAAQAERGAQNQNAQMNNPGQQLSANMKPQKKIEPLVVQQKRNNKLHGAG